MLLIWDDSDTLPDWIVDFGGWVQSFSINLYWFISWASFGSSSWLWSLAGSNDSIGKIISQWDV